MFELFSPYIIAPLLGIIPALIWLFFWLSEDTHPEPVRLITLCFLAGQLVVFFVLPLQKIVHELIHDQSLLFLTWAGIEELLKLLAALLVAIHTRSDDEPVDPLIYMIIVALGFVSLENTLFLWNPVQSGNLVETLTTGNLRFIGASLVHVLSSAVIGVFLAFSFYQKTMYKIIAGIAGLILATTLHTYFNLFIIKETEGNLFLIFGFVWIGIVGLMLMFEKIKHIIPKTQQ